MDRHQLDRRDSQSLQVLDDRRMRQPLVGAALLLRDQRMQLGQAADVRLVDHGLVVARPRRPVNAPVEVRIHHHRPRHVRRRIRVVALVRVPDGVGIHRGVPADAALDRLRIRIQQQLGRVAAVPGSRVIGAVDPVPVPLARSDARQVTMPDEPVHLAQRHPGLRAVVGEQAQFHLLGYLREHGEVSPRTVITRPQRVTVARPHRRICCHRSALPLMPATATPCPTSTTFTPVLAGPAAAPAWLQEPAGPARKQGGRPAGHQRSGQAAADKAEPARAARPH